MPFTGGRLRCRNRPTRGVGPAGGPPSLVLSFPWRPPSLVFCLSFFFAPAVTDGDRGEVSFGSRDIARSLPSEAFLSLSLRSCLDVTASLRVGVLSKGDDVVAVVVGGAVSSHYVINKSTKGVQSFRRFSGGRVTSLHSHVVGAVARRASLAASELSIAVGEAIDGTRVAKVFTSFSQIVIIGSEIPCKTDDRSRGPTVRTLAESSARGRAASFAKQTATKRRRRRRRMGVRE